MTVTPVIPALRRKYKENFESSQPTEACFKQTNKKTKKQTKNKA